MIPKDPVFVVEGLRGEPFHRVDLVFLCDYNGVLGHVALYGANPQALP